MKHLLKDVPNGENLGIKMDWDNDPCQEIVDQKYRVNISFCEKLKTTSPLKCFVFISELESAGLQPVIEERLFSATNGEFWNKISKSELKKILDGIRTPATRLISCSNPRFNSKLMCD